MTWQCPLVRKDLSRYFDAELGDRRSARIERHLDRCPQCRRELDKLVETVHFVAHERPVPPPQEGWRTLATALWSGQQESDASPAGRPLFSGRHRTSTRKLVLAAAAVLLMAVAVPLGLRLMTPTRALAHEVDLSLLLSDLRHRTFTPAGTFWRVYGVEEIDRTLVGDACPSGYYFPPELPAGFVLKRSLLFKTDCCPGLMLEYHRADHYLIIVQVSAHHPMHWGDLPCRVVQFDQISFEVQDHPLLSAVACTGGPVNLFVAGNIEPDLLGAVASHMHRHTETAASMVSLWDTR
jgi:hypothetical protein